MPVRVAMRRSLGVRDGPWTASVRQYPHGMRFTKAHGTGNSFVVLPDWDDELDLEAELVRALCDPQRGIGADGVLRIVAGDGDSDAFMDYRNADGSIAEMCGNGVRVVAKHVVDHGLVTPQGGALRIGTRAGSREVQITLGYDGRVGSATVDMGRPDLTASEVPFDSDRDVAVAEPLEVGGTIVELTAVSMGNPHAVIVVDDVSDARVHELGAAIESHVRFPERTNVEFVEIAGPGEARVRVWERGVGETAACGSGACAVLVALRELGEADGSVQLRFPGGILEVDYEPEVAPSVHLRGPAVEVAVGTLDPDWVDAVAHRS